LDLCIFSLSVLKFGTELALFGRLALRNDSSLL